MVIRIYHVGECCGITTPLWRETILCDLARVVGAGGRGWGQTDPSLPPELPAHRGYALKQEQAGVAGGSIRSAQPGRIHDRSGKTFPTSTGYEQRPGLAITVRPPHASADMRALADSISSPSGSPPTRMCAPIDPGP